MSQTGKQVKAIVIFLNTSRSKGNQVIKFIQSTEHNVRNIFL